MVFVTIGNARQGFLRLLNAVEELAAQGAFGDEPVMIQSGNNPEFRPRYCAAEPFLSMEQFSQNVRKASLVISHAGCGTLSYIVKEGKPAVVMPRRFHYGELIDDHQVQLLEAFAEKGWIVPAYEAKDLGKAIQTVRSRPVMPFEDLSQAPQKIMEAVKSLLRCVED